MIDRIVLNTDKTKALIVYTDKAPIELSHSEGLVLDLVIYLLTPNVNTDVTYNSYLNSLGDTAIVNIDDIIAA